MKKLPIHVKIVIGLVLGIGWAFLSSLWGGMNLPFVGLILLV